jgi:hypothetical protein
MHGKFTHPVLKHFERIEHSKSWPSDDPNDTPIVTYKCLHKKCRWKYSFVAYGTFPIGVNPEEKSLGILRDHLLFDHALGPIREE